MCDYSLESVRSRPAAVGDKLVTRNFGTGTIGFACMADPVPTAVCCLPGTEIAFDAPIKSFQLGVSEEIRHTVARFRHLNMDTRLIHHDALELPDGQQVFLNHLCVAQTATVLQLPAPAIEEKAEPVAKVDASVEALLESIGH
jgi:hypothetical protein